MTDELFLPVRDAWAALRNEYSEIFPRGDREEAVYGLPDSLIDAISQEAPGFIADRELELERALSAFFRQQHAIGLYKRNLVRSSLFEERAPVTVSPEDFKDLGWEQFDLSCEDVNLSCKEAEARAVVFHDQLVAYSGWLVTNPMFLREVAIWRQREQEFIAVQTETASEELVKEINVLFDRWQLAGMASWDLPEPQGPHLGSFDGLPAIRQATSMVTLMLPVTVRLPARFPIRELVAEVGDQTDQAHLAEWRAIIHQSSRGTVGLQRFQHILHVHFFRNIVLKARYSDRFEGRVSALDRAFGSYLGGLGEDSVIRIRREITRRFATPDG